MRHKQIPQGNKNIGGNPEVDSRKGGLGFLDYVGIKTQKEVNHKKAEQYRFYIHSIDSKRILLKIQIKIKNPGPSQD